MIVLLLHINLTIIRKVKCSHYFQFFLYFALFGCSLVLVFTLLFSFWSVRNRTFKKRASLDSRKKELSTYKISGMIKVPGRGWDSTVGVETKVQEDRETGVRFSSRKRPKLSLDPTQPPISWVPVALSLW
jgi:hypothetical protein